ncbi:hypothetical protein FOMPIDRAFT_158841 [Fomitopsis schrenkii]|uniref:MARVEL domain-containing protein n=1 Tax=Fomitopsis schrenkii TaxID=2126942 RepID=S8ET80_FOMSC|nr:hypothetical protein FOMPIDRAFT_158841 [Fomitopsis schrenkii]
MFKLPVSSSLEKIVLPPFFTRARIATFVVMTMLSLVGITLLCVELFVRADVTDNPQRNIVLLLILSYSFTSIIFPAMLIPQCTPLWEAARLVCLLFFQIGTSGVYTSWYSTFTCPEPSRNCKRMNMAILASVWVMPSLLLFYSGALGLIVWRSYKYPDFQLATLREKRESELPMMSPPPEQLRIRSSAFAALLEAGGLAPSVPSVPVLPVAMGPVLDKRNSSQSLKSTSSNSSGRLAKGRPKHFY